MASAWTPKRIERLTELWAREFSCSRIAGELNANGFAPLPPLSRNGVIGKLHRMGLALAVDEVRRRKGWKHLPAEGLAAKRDRVRRIHQARMPRAERPNPLRSNASIEPAAMHCAAVAALRPRKLTSLADLESHMCRFPYEWTAADPSPDSLKYGYCGVWVAYDGCPWCARHLRLVCG